MKIRDKSIKTSTNIELIVVVVVVNDIKTKEIISTKFFLRLAREFINTVRWIILEEFLWKTLFNGNDWNEKNHKLTIASFKYSVVRIENVQSNSLVSFWICFDSSFRFFFFKEYSVIHTILFNLLRYQWWVSDIRKQDIDATRYIVTACKYLWKWYCLC